MAYALSLHAARAQQGLGSETPGPEVPTQFAEFVRALRTDAPREVVSLGARERAVGLRQDIEDRINAGQIVELDFLGVDATQSFMDELVGILVLERGPEVLSFIKFRRCSADLKGILQFVVNDRALQHLEAPRFKAPR